MFTPKKWTIEYPPPLPEYDPADPTKLSKPRDNPLGNPLIYFVTTPRANDYRSLMFDTPEEVQDAVQYQAHMQTCKALDPNFTVEPTVGGQLTTPQSKHTVPTNLPLIDYLVRADYYGNTVFAPTTTLGGTEFTVKMLVDSLSQPGVTIGENPPTPTFENIGPIPIEVISSADLIVAVGGGGGGGGGGGRVSTSTISRGHKGSSSGTIHDEIDLKEVFWLHGDISLWRQVVEITNATAQEGNISVQFTNQNWNDSDYSGSGAKVDANYWVFAKIGGTWYAATWEWRREGTTKKSFRAGAFKTHVNNVSPLNRWTPRTGEQIGLMVSTPARLGVPAGTARERTNVILVNWGDQYSS